MTSQSLGASGGSVPVSPPIPGEELSVALALVNTRLDGPEGRVDLLSDPASARAWLTVHGLVSAGAGECGAADLPLDADAVARLTGLRESIRILFDARLAGGVDSAGGADGVAGFLGVGGGAQAGFPGLAAALDDVNTAFAAAPCVTRLVWDENGPQVTQQRRSGDPLAKVLAALAASAAELLAGPLADRLARCEAHNCIRVFIRTHAARHVCSTRCGDRVRAARHYARKRERERDQERARERKQGTVRREHLTTGTDSGGSDGRAGP
ncbi:CGNR zinc finger domain-containing protein [Actinocrinis puniceicyclus]|uniref:CGNR zinc finger domain-containing protein n=1 Tax=Actinocrinis puniceicyclus TaxID=977794 RepID=A0A8J8BG16_9ACTN|nr:CGNR zinc finger domain-containing protein [Actinocrinis puniceicyclus]MBS2965274.1 CGNR zinc finger domain-containing protein [Actinocrinis puniceicyclus]